MTHRVARPAARKLVETYGETRVRARLARFKTLLTSGYKARSPSALLVDIIRDNEGKYVDPAAVTETVPTPKATKPVAAPRDPEVEDRERQAAFQALSLEQQADQAMPTLQLLLKNRLDTMQYARIRSAMAEGRADASLIVKAVTKAVFDGRVDEAIEQLTLL